MKVFVRILVQAILALALGASMAILFASTQAKIGTTVVLISAVVFMFSSVVLFILNDNEPERTR